MYDLSLRRTVYDVQCTTYSVRLTVYDVQCTTYSVRLKYTYTSYSIRLTDYDVNCQYLHEIRHSGQRTVYVVQWITNSIRRICTLYTVYCTVYTRLYHTLSVHSPIQVIYPQLIPGLSHIRLVILSYTVPRLYTQTIRPLLHVHCMRYILLVETLCVLNCMVYAVHCTTCSVHSELYGVHCTQ